MKPTTDPSLLLTVSCLSCISFTRFYTLPFIRLLFHSYMISLTHLLHSLFLHALTHFLLCYTYLSGILLSYLLSLSLILSYLSSLSLSYSLHSLLLLLLHTSLTHIGVGKIPMFLDFTEEVTGESRIERSKKREWLHNWMNNNVYLNIREFPGNIGSENDM